MIFIQDDQLSIHTDIDVLFRLSFQVRGQLKLDANALQTMAQDLSDCVKVTSELVYIAAYSGTDHESQTQLAKSLKEIAKSKVNPEYKRQNIKSLSQNKDDVV